MVCYADAACALVHSHCAHLSLSLNSILSTAWLLTAYKPHPATHSRCARLSLSANSMPFLPLGSSLLARRALEMYGWNVVVLPWYEWATLQVIDRCVCTCLCACVCVSKCVIVFN